MAFGITQAKSIFTSKTFWGSVIGLVSVLFPTFFQHLAAAFGISDPSLIASKIVGGIGALLAIYGRFAAVQPVTLTGGPTLVPIVGVPPIGSVPLNAPAQSIFAKDPNPNLPAPSQKIATMEVVTTIIPTDPAKPKTVSSTKSDVMWPDPNAKSE
jgi:hypothetical protein